MSIAGKKNAENNAKETNDGISEMDIMPAKRLENCWHVIFNPI